ncbi:MAG: hypothetical protein IPL78_28685 [Chloroflexi bacterium]|nr:hypothetical protein [Chloroflexota bacterium]
MTRWLFAFWEPELPASNEQAVLLITGRWPLHLFYSPLIHATVLLICTPIDTPILRP